MASMQVILDKDYTTACMELKSYGSGAVANWNVKQRRLAIIISHCPQQPIPTTSLKKSRIRDIPTLCLKTT